MDVQPNVVRRAINRAFGPLRFPYLFLLTAGLFLFDLVIPDFVPMADEIILGLLTLMLGSWRDRKQEQPPATNPE